MYSLEDFVLNVFFPQSQSFSAFIKDLGNILSVLYHVIGLFHTDIVSCVKASELMFLMI